MTLGTAIDIVDQQIPNQIEYADKVRWLSELDGKIYAEQLATHVGFEHVHYIPFTENVPQQHPLLAPHPYDALYIDYLEMHIQDVNQETYKYNNAAMKFNHKFQEFVDWVNRTHPPKRARSFRLW